MKKLKKRIAVFGGGMTGLSAARELIRAGHEVDLYEASGRIGGLASTYQSDGFIYDNGPRFIFSTLAEKLGILEQCEPVKYYEDLRVGGRNYLFPFGFAKNPAYCLSAGIATLTRFFRKKPENLREFLEIYYGKFFSRSVLAPLIEKWAGIPSEEISLDFASRLLPTNVAYILYSLVKKIRGGVTEDYYKKGRYIVYPKGSNAVIFETLAKTPGLRVHLNAPLEKLATENGRVVSAVAGGNEISADFYASTIPVGKLLGALNAPEKMHGWENLRYRGILILFIKIRRPRVLEHLWTWFPEAKYRFYRISEFKNALPSLAPKESTLIGVEIACQEDDPYWQSGAEEIYGSIAEDLHDLYGLRLEEISGFDLRKSPHAYPVLRKDTEDFRRAVTHRTPFENLFVAGRTGMFQYRMLEGCYESAISCVETMRAAMEGSGVETRTTDTDRYGRPLVVHE